MEQFLKQLTDSMKKLQPHDIEEATQNLKVVNSDYIASGVDRNLKMVAYDNIG